MSVQTANIYDWRGRARPLHMEETGAIYAAFARDTEGNGLVKIGASRRPVLRIREVSQGSPFPILAFLWGWVGRRDEAFEAERLVKCQFAHRKLQGEWFRFDFTKGSGDKEEFHSEIKRICRLVTGRELLLTKGDMGQVRAARALTRKRPDGTRFVTAE